MYVLAGGEGIESGWNSMSSTN